MQVQYDGDQGHLGVGHQDDQKRAVHSHVKRNKLE